MIRRIIRIDKEKCNGCGACAEACHEGAIVMADGKAQLAVFEDGALRYEIIRQYVGDEASSFQIQITNRAKGYVSSLDNMGGVITVFEY